MSFRRLSIFAMLLGVCSGLTVGAQANSQAEDRARIDLAGLSRGPVIIGGGLFFGETSGISAKLWFPETGFGLDALAAWSFQDEGAVYLHSDVIYHLALIETAGGRYVVPSVGFGVLGRIGENGGIGIRLPVALSLFLFPAVPVELFGEISPGIGIYPDTGEEFGVGLGVRFYLPVRSR